jgi:hypothetical protein
MVNVVTSEKYPEVVREDGSWLARKDGPAKVLMAAFIETMAEIFQEFSR